MELTDEVLDGLIALWTQPRGPKLSDLAKLVGADKNLLEDAMAMRVKALLALLAPHVIVPAGSHYGEPAK